MGRKFLSKSRIEDPDLKRRWAAELTPLFLERGLKLFPMDLVAAELGISKATLYKYFRSREEILDLAMEIKLLEIRRYQATLSNHDLPYLERFLAALQITSAELSSISTLFLSDLKETYPRVWVRVQQFIEEGLRVLRIFYEEGIDRGDLAPVHPAVLVITDELFFSQLAEPQFLEQRGLTVQEALESYFLLKFGGMFTQSQLSLPAVRKQLDQMLEKLATRNRGTAASGVRTKNETTSGPRPKL